VREREGESRDEGGEHVPPASGRDWAGGAHSKRELEASAAAAWGHIPLSCVNTSAKKIKKRRGLYACWKLQSF
jgi:hypothetical protein